MLEIEGTRNERIFVVIASYVIGFTTAYICFGAIDQSYQNAVPQITYATTEQASPAAYTMADLASVAAGQAAAVYNSGMLEVTAADGTPRTVSVAADTLDEASLQALGGGPGVHTELMHYALSDDRAYLYFCEQHERAGSCEAYVYDLNENVIRYVTIDGAPAVFNQDVAASAAWRDGILTVGSFRSTTTAEPWKLTAGE